LRRPLLDKNRIAALSDGIYAIAMTLAVLSIDVDTEVSTHQSLLSSLPLMIVQLRHYAVAFVTLGGFWIGQHYLMDRINKTDTALNWIVMVHLLFIAVIPATTDLIGNFDSILAVQIFIVNIFLISISIVVEYAYVRRTAALGASDELKKHVPYGALIFPAYSVFVFILAWFVEDWATLAYVFMPLIRKILS
jgi:uncharacterized membrane protein